MLAEPILALFVALCLYLGLGASWTNLISVNFRGLALAGFAGIAALWFLARSMRRWQWRRNPLDAALLLWGFAFAISLVANLEDWRRIVIGLWFASLYVSLWYILSDCMANGTLKRHTLIDGLLMAGGIAIYNGYQELFRWFSTNGQAILQRQSAGANPIFALLEAAPRVRSTLDNPNPFATVLLVLLPLALARTFSAARWWQRGLYAAYSLLCAILLVLTQTRGAWLGMGGAVAAFGALLLVHYGLRIRPIVLFGLVVAVVGVAVIGVTSTRGWVDEGRITLYQTAIRLFSEKPLTGHGLYTFGKGLLRLVGVIPTEVPHAQAHDLPLNVAAELGIPGLVALLATAALLGYACLQNWRALAGRDRILIAGGVASVFGFAIHHLFDVTGILPAVALAGLASLVAAAAPGESTKPAAFSPPVRFRPASLAILIALLVAVGAWDNHVYGRFRAAIDYYFASGYNTEGTVSQLRAVVNDDPQVPLYLTTLAYMLDRMLDKEGAQAVYDKFCSVAPYYALPPNDTQIAILHYLRFSPLRLSQPFWQNYSCPPHG